MLLLAYFSLDTVAFRHESLPDLVRDAVEVKPLALEGKGSIALLGAIVAAVLSSPELRAMWEDELAGMRERIRAMRAGLVDALKAKGTAQDFSFIIKQRGMFSYTGLSAAQVARLQQEFGIYAVSSGRICLAALNSKNLGYVADAITQVL